MHCILYNIQCISIALSTHIVTVLHKIAGVEVDHDQATSLANSLQDIVGHIPVVVRHCAGSTVGEDDRGEGDVQDMAHGGGRHVGQVHHHAESVHLKHHVRSKLKKNVVCLQQNCGIFPLHA